MDVLATLFVPGATGYASMLASEALEPSGLFGDE
jgi:hypothetical protein